MKLSLELSRAEIEQIILNHASQENGLQRRQVELVWDKDHNLKIIQEDQLPNGREWLEVSNNSEEGENNDS